MRYPSNHSTIHKAVLSEINIFSSWLGSVFRRTKTSDSQSQIEAEAEERGYLRGIDEAAQLFETKSNWRLSSSEDAAWAIRSLPHQRRRRAVGSGRAN